MSLNLEVGPETGDVTFGVVWARGLEPGSRPPLLDQAIEGMVQARAGALTDALESVRLASRDMLRHGGYKPTGRGKPASEYLLRAARQDTFPRINAPVDICNLISLKYMIPASVWDRDRAAALAGGDGHVFRARRGRPGEQFVFNAAGQEIDLGHLLLISAGESDAPIVNPVKDCQATKTHPESRCIGAVVYAPARAELDVAAICSEFAGFLAACGSGVQVGWGRHPGQP